MPSPVTASPLPALRVLPADRGADWLGEAYGLFRRKPGVWIGILLIWLVLSMVIGAVPGLGIIGPFLNPIFSAGILLGCASLARGEALRVEHLFAGFRSGRVGQLLMMTVWTLLLGVVAIVLVLLIVGLPMLDAIRQSTPPEELLYAIGPWQALIAGALTLALSLLFVMAVWFAPALILFRGLSALDALKLSVRGCLVNWLPLTVYGLLALAMLVVAMIPLLLGLLVAIPVLMASVYTAYRDIYPEPAA